MTTNPVQLFDPESSTFTYILIADDQRSAVIIDPVERHVERDLKHLERLGVQLVYVLETHAHADHVTSVRQARALTGAQAAVPSGCGIAADRGAAQRRRHRPLRRARPDRRAAYARPHGLSSVSYLWRDNLFTGDTLLIDGCGRTDFQSGSAQALYDSVTDKLFTLPDATRVWPGHDYKGQSVSTIGWEKRHNARLANRSKDDFCALMATLNLPKPRLIDIVVLKPIKTSGCRTAFDILTALNRQAHDVGAPPTSWIPNAQVHRAAARSAASLPLHAAPLPARSDIFNSVTHSRPAISASGKWIASTAVSDGKLRIFPMAGGAAKDLGLPAGVRPVLPLDQRRS
ncbi:MBL fold metallo-hydrolase [Massilia sp. H-1]|nr:MBL fold metallo-hydrolase [Massilia sp. H-1]